ncbi:MAG: dihydrofolate reductase family protein [Bacteroidota bacterium]|jgi:dihydrofolate reductase
MLETQRLILRPLTYEQLVKYAKCDNSLEAELNVNKSSRTISAELKEALENTILPNMADKTNNYLYSTLWTAISKANNEMVGDLCIFGEPNAEGDINIGYGTYDEFQGKGFMTEIVGGIITWARTQPLVKSITASTDRKNTASVKVLLKNNFVITQETDTSFIWKFTMSKRRLILYIAMSLDGYIAESNDDLSFLSIVEQEGQDYGYADFVKTVDTVILGRKTYDKVISMGFDFPHADKDAYIITRTSRPNIGSVKFYTGDLTLLVNQLKSQNGKNLFCEGGAEIVHELLKEDLIDEFIISIIPILVGNGTKLFKDGRPEKKLELVSVKSFDRGLTQLYYKRANK